MDLLIEADNYSDQGGVLNIFWKVTPFYRQNFLDALEGLDICIKSGLNGFKHNLKW